ncbi:MAG: haloacid dehalogenase-like hydrolase [Chromatiales bacterium]
MQDIIAVIFDFDDTLAPDSTTGYLRRLGADTARFWKEDVNTLIRQDWDPVPAYLFTMIAQSRGGVIPPITRENLAQWGRDLPLHAGVETLFARLRNCAKEVHPRVAIEFYLISSGLGDVVRNTRIAQEFTDIWASEFHYDEKGHALFARRIVSFTDKTRYLFHIQKGIIGPPSRANPLAVNKKVSPHQIRIPMHQFIFIGDGMTDIPCFSLVTKEEGIAVGVYDRNHVEKWSDAFNFVSEGRVKTLYSANYTEQSDLSTFLLMAVRNKAESIVVRSGSYQG